MTLYDIKPKFQNLLRPLVVKFHSWGITANQVTIFAMLISVLIGILLSLFPDPLFFICLPGYLFFRMALNAIDGMLAREYHQQTRLGAILNEAGDIISDAALYLPFACLAGVSPRLVVLVVLLSWLTEFCGIVHQTLTRERNYCGPLGKSDRALLFGATGLIVALAPGLVVYLNIVMVAATLLLIRTCYNRCRSAMECENV
ncbi:CDP-alcohol phosphatidyltransferase family protein [Atlantibacter subterraneus]|uniref:CDP-alcohol phosphatidyltransferase family protein n=1 Tax=Atlantibacter subterraneus TaxID=255519 RepID=UPI00289D96E0|nr:CDP-alcohol phosphatidyltransferase family protein [Atlantibacter subterranea]MDW2741223.1 CDP-alcohol phosphatidyltransferase family protein [Atlantibacter subterranea]